MWLNVCWRGYYISNTLTLLLSVAGQYAVLHSSQVGSRYRACICRHLKDLEVAPHPRKVHVRSDTLRTWKWSSTPKMLSSINPSNINRNGFQRPPPQKKKKNWNPISVLLCFHILQKSKMIPRSIRTFWYKDSAENNEKWQVWKKDYISQK